MSHSQPEPGPPTAAAEPAAPTERVERCRTCGALNGTGFTSCIRCGHPLGGAVGEDGGPGARASSHPPPRRLRFDPRELPATALLLGLTTLSFLVQLAVALAREPSLAVLLTGGSSVDLVRCGALPLGSVTLLTAEPWRLASAIFVHVGVIHLGLNAAGLVYLGRMLEPAVGPVRLLLIYLATGLAGFVVSAAVAIAIGTHALTAGASGALFGLMGAVLGILLVRRDRRWRLWVTQAVLFALAFGFAVGVANNAAHIGGLALGLPLGLLVGRGELRPASRWQRLAAAVGLAACLLALLLAQRSDLWRLLAEAASAP